MRREAGTPLGLNQSTYKQENHRGSNVLLGDLASHEETLEILQETPGVEGLSELVVVVAGHTVVADNALEHALHSFVRGHIIFIINYFTPIAHGGTEGRPLCPACGQFNTEPF